MTKPLLEIAKAVVQTEADSILMLKDRIDQTFNDVCQLILSCQGKVILIGMGKSGHIAKKIAATLASTGTPSFYVHPGEAGHGDLGVVNDKDVVFIISYSGESDEIVTLLPSIKRLNVAVISMTGNSSSTIAEESDVHLDVSVDQEACPHNLTPTSSTTVALVMGDAIAITLLNARGFTPEDFAKSHPSGALGRRLLTLVSNIMKSGDDIPIVSKEISLIDSLLVMSQKALGMVLITDKNTLLGIFTDGDLRRMLQKGYSKTLTAQELMSTNPQQIPSEMLIADALSILKEKNISQLLVTENGAYIGVLHIHAILAEGF